MGGRESKLKMDYLFTMMTNQLNGFEVKKASKNLYLQLPQNKTSRVGKKY